MVLPESDLNEAGSDAAYSRIAPFLNGFSCWWRFSQVSDLIPHSSTYSLQTAVSGNRSATVPFIERDRRYHERTRGLSMSYDEDLKLYTCTSRHE